MAWSHVSRVSIPKFKNSNISFTRHELFQNAFFISFFDFSYEGGRVTSGQSTCAVAINKTQDSDNGKWTCQISTMDARNNAILYTADVDVTVAGKVL